MYKSLVLYALAGIAIADCLTDFETWCDEAKKSTIEELLMDDVCEAGLTELCDEYDQLVDDMNDGDPESTVDLAKIEAFLKNQFKSLGL